MDCNVNPAQPVKLEAGKGYWLTRMHDNLPAPFAGRFAFASTGSQSLLEDEDERVVLFDDAEAAHAWLTTCIVEHGHSLEERPHHTVEVVRVEERAHHGAVPVMDSASDEVEIGEGDAAPVPPEVTR